MAEDDSERRKRVRLENLDQLTLDITAIDEAPPTDALKSGCDAVDVSPGGLRLRLAERVETGSRIDLAVNLGAPSGGLRLSGEVRWSVQDGVSHLAGIQLHDRPGFDLRTWREMLGP